jgi:hypothetical protein
VIRLEQERRYGVARDAAFEYVTDPRNWPAFWPDLAGIDDPEARWRRPGDTMRLRMRLAGRATDLVMVLDEYAPPSLVTYRTEQPGLPDARHERHFEPDGDGLRYRVAVSYDPRPGLHGLLDRTLVRWGIRRALRRTLDNLEHVLPPAGA